MLGTNKYVLLYSLVRGVAGRAGDLLLVHIVRCVVGSVGVLGRGVVGREAEKRDDDSCVGHELLDVLGEVVDEPHDGLVAVTVAADLVGDVVGVDSVHDRSELVPVAFNVGEVLAHAAVVLDRLVDVVEGGLAGEVEHRLELLELLDAPLVTGPGLGGSVLQPAVEDVTHVVEVVALVLVTGDGLLGPHLVSLGDGSLHFFLALGVTFVGALDPEQSASLLLALGRGGLKQALILRNSVGALGEDLQAVEGLPHPDDLSLVGGGPQVVRAESPVIKGLLRSGVLDADRFPSDVEHLLRPVGVDRAHELVSRLSSFPDLGADALADAERIPGELVDDPEVGVLVQNLGGNVSHNSLAVEVEAQRSTLAANVVVLGTVVGAVAKLADRIV
mmetsp:Transcript_21620/g.40681  ORF Transcript_21620/g.40681 Transcript_21620/m.40681 type:complete len:388 (+) Transcript_21620:93-1256(+)